MHPKYYLNNIYFLTGSSIIAYEESNAIDIKYFIKEKVIKDINNYT